MLVFAGVQVARTFFQRPVLKLLFDRYDWGSGPLDVVHVDGHADLGMGDPSWVDLISHVGKPLSERHQPRRANQGLNLGTWLAYALAAEFIFRLLFVPSRQKK